MSYEPMSLQPALTLQQNNQFEQERLINAYSQKVTVTGKEAGSVSVTITVTTMVTSTVTERLTLHWDCTSTLHT